MSENGLCFLPWVQSSQIGKALFGNDHIHIVLGVVEGVTGGTLS